MAGRCRTISRWWWSSTPRSRTEPRRDSGRGHLVAAGVLGAIERRVRGTHPGIKTVIAVVRLGDADAERAAQCRVDVEGLALGFRAGALGHLDGPRPVGGRK